LIKVAKKQDNKDASLELAQAEERIETIKAEIAEALIQRNTLPTSASDEEKAAAAERVEQLQEQHHEAVQHVLAIKREETARLEREHKEKKQRHKRLKAAHQPGGHTAPHQDAPAPPQRTAVRRPPNRAAEDAHMDAANEQDLILERQRLQEDEKETAEELAHLRRLAEKKRKKEEAAKLREAAKREKEQARAKAQAEQLKAEKEERAKARQQAALHRAEEAKAKKRQQRAEREARQRAGHDARSPGWISEIIRQIKAFFGGRN